MELKYDLLENGLDFIWVSLERLSGEPNKQDLKYAVLHLWSGVELILKERLRREHWCLVFEKLDSVDRTSYEHGRFLSVRFESCVERLKRICSVSIPDKHMKSFNRLREVRNRIEHFGIIESVDSVKSDASETINAILHFVDIHLRQETFGLTETELLNDIRKRLAEFQTFLSNKWAEIRRRLNEGEYSGRRLFTCPICKQVAMVALHGGHCLFCQHKSTASVAASEYVKSVYGLDHSVLVVPAEELGIAQITIPPYRCPKCDEETLVVNDPTDTRYPTIEYFCFSCGQLWKKDRLVTCIYCGYPIVPMDDEQYEDICDACRNELDVCSGIYCN